MVLFEIWTVGKKPFPDLSNSQMLCLFQTRACQAPPPGCPRAIYKLMVECWYVRMMTLHIFLTHFKVQTAEYPQTMLTQYK